jgi:hypothetical protein
MLGCIIILYSPVEIELFLNDNIKKIKINFKNENKILNGGGFFKNLTTFITSGEILESDK